MSGRDPVYTISDEDVQDTLETLRKLNSRTSSSPMNETRPAARPERVRYREPRPSAKALMASSLSLFLFGAGQLYNRQVKLGILLLLTELLAVVSHWSAVRTWSSVSETAGLFGIGTHEMLLAAAGIDLMLIVLVLLGVRQAYRRAEAESGHFTGMENPILSGFASLLVPGWGQLFNAQLGKGLFFILCLLLAFYTTAFVAFTPLVDLHTLSGLPGPFRSPANAGGAVLFCLALLWTVSVYDAILVAGYQRRLT